MTLSIILWVLSIGIEGIIIYFGNLHLIWYVYVIGLFLLPIFFLLLFGLVLFILFFVGLIIKTDKDVDKPSNVAYWWTFQVNYILCVLTSSIKVRNKELVPKDRRYVMVFNHRSNWDPMVLMKEFMDRKMYFVTKPSNTKIPIAGPFMKRAGFIPIDRENNKEGLKAVIKAINRIKSNKGSIGIAPEGTRNKNLETPLLEFHAGSFKIAYKAEAPIVVTSLKGCENIHKNFPKRTDIEINILKVYEFEEYKDKSTVELSDEIYKLIEKDLVGE